MLFSDAALRAFAAFEPNDNTERMVREITLGVPKADACSVVTDADSARWDQLAIQIAEIMAAGYMLITG